MAKNNDYCLEFKSSLNKAILPANPAIDFSKSFSVCLHIKAITHVGHGGILTTNVPNSTPFSITNLGAGRFRVRSSVEEFAFSLQYNQWSHLSIISDGVTWRVYIDGVYEGSLKGSTHNNISSILLGIDPYSNDRYFIGKLDNLCIFNAEINEKTLLKTASKILDKKNPI